MADDEVAVLYGWHPWAGRSILVGGSDRGGQRAAALDSLIVTCKLNDIDPQAWLADMLEHVASYPAHRLDELLLWNWKKLRAHGSHQKAD